MTAKRGWPAFINLNVTPTRYKSGGSGCKVFNNSIHNNQHCSLTSANITTMSSSLKPSNTDDVKQWVVVRPTFDYHLCLYAGNSKFCKRLKTLVDPPDILKTQELSKISSQ